MSRIIVKQLPKNITESKLREIFGSKGAITDIQLKYTADGVFRQFAYIGYHGENEAQSAVNFFNNSCIQANRIKVETCATLGSDEKPKSWSKYAKDSYKYKNKNADIHVEGNIEKPKTKKISKYEEIIGEYKDDPQFKEFMSVHEKNRTLWGNDAEEEQSIPCDENKNVKFVDSDKEEYISGELVRGVDTEKQDERIEKSLNEENNSAKEDVSDMEYMKSLIKEDLLPADNKNNSSKSKSCVKSLKSKIDLFTIKIRNVPYEIKRQEIIKFFKPLKPYSVRLPTKSHGFCYVGFKTEKDMKKAMLKNKSFISGKQVFLYDFTERNKIAKSLLIESIDGNQTISHKSTKWAKQLGSLEGEEDISDSGRIFFRNLAYTVNEDDIQKVFEKYGPIAEISLPVDGVTRQIKGFGTVTFVMPEHAVQAFNKLDGICFHGRLLHLMPAKSKDIKEDENVHESSYKNKKSAQIKKSAQQQYNWNSLFLGSNAVAEILSKQFDTTKENILDTNAGGSSAGVRMALGETQIVIEMKRFLEENGVCLAAFDVKSTKRSKTTILAKNLPAGTTAAELNPLFEKFGPISRILLPPSGVTAIVEFCEPSEARKAFTKLAYSKFKNLPLFLEWAPENVFQLTNKLMKEPKNETVEQSIVKSYQKEHLSEETKVDSVNEIPQEYDFDDDPPPEPNTTIFLRNLNFKTVQQTVIDHFRHLGPIHHVEIAMRRDPENPKNKTSLGYGFIQFKKTETASKALKEMQFTTIDNKQVELKRSDRILRMDDATALRKTCTITKQTGSKILVRNIPFQAKTNEVRDIFKAFGNLRSVRLPMKTAPGAETHRGFGFVDFITKSDAKKALEALSQSTHLYGRRLVLEWASNDENDIEELRKRTAIKFEQSESKTKRQRKADFDTTTIEMNAESEIS